MLSKISYLKLALLFLVILSFYSSAEEIPIKIKADDLRYDQESGTITAKSNVKVYFKEVELHSDNANIDLNANVATLEGNVEIIRGDYVAKAKQVNYDISSEVTVVFDVRSVIKPAEIKGNLYLSSQSLKDFVDHQNGEEGSATTCDYEDPHYHVRSRWFEYYPDDKLVGFSNTFYAGQVPLFWTPYYIFNLKEKRSPYNFAYGENEVEGKFLKTAFDYYINRDNYGILYVDSTEKKGPGYGFEHEYLLNDSNSGVLYLYSIHEQDTGLGDYVVRWNHNIALDDYSKLSLSHRSAFIYKIPSGRIDENGSTVAYNFNDGKKRLDYSISTLDDRFTFLHSESMGINYSNEDLRSGFYYDNSKSLSSPKWDRTHERFFHEQSFFSPDARISINMNYEKNATDEAVVADEKLEPRIDITYKGAFYSMKLTQNWYVDLDEKRYRGDDNYEYLERLPELTVNFNPMNLGFFNLDLNVGAARYHEAKYISSLARMRHMTLNRYSFGGNISRSDDIGFGTVFRQKYGVDQYLYEPGDQRYQLRETLGTETNLWGFFRNNIDYNRALSEGNTPFFFDNLGSNYNNIKDKITLYYLDKVNFMIDGGYNYQTSQYFDVLTNLLIIPSEQLRLNFSTGWSIENQKYRDLVASATFIPFPRFTNTGGLVYDLNTGILLSANSVMDLEIGEDWQSRWHFRVGHTYDFETSQYMVRDVAIVKDLHCWEAMYTYSDYKKEHRIGFTLKAFPNMPVGLNVSGQGSYFDGFYQNLSYGESPSPRRY